MPTDQMMWPTDQKKWPSIKHRATPTLNIPPFHSEPTWMEDLSHRPGDVAVVLEVLGQRGEVAGQSPEVGLQVKDACRVRSAAGQERCPAG